MPARATISSTFTREVSTPRYSQRASFSRMAMSRRPVSLLTKRSAVSVAASSIAAAIQNQTRVSRSKLSKPDRPLDEPVKLPPAKMTWVTTIGSTRESTEAYSGVAPG